MSSFLVSVLEDVTVGYLESEEAFIYNKIHPNNALCRKSLRVTKDQALKYSAMNAWIEGLAILEPYDLNDALNYASKGGQLSIVKMLIDRGANNIDKALDTASYEGHIPAMKWLYEYRRRIIPDGTYIEEILMYTCLGGHMSAVQWAIDLGEQDMQIALNSAAEGGHVHIMNYIVERFDMDMDWSDALSYAGLGGHIPAMEWIEARAIERNVPIDYNASLCEASSEGHFDAIVWLKNHGADDWNSALAESMRHCDMKIIQWIIDQGAHDMNRAFVRASMYGDIDMMEWLLERGANNFNDAFDAAPYGGVHTLKWLISKRGMPPLTLLNSACLYASMYDRAPEIQFLMDCGANNLDLCYDTACRFGNVEVMKCSMVFNICRLDIYLNDEYLIDTE